MKPLHLPQIILAGISLITPAFAAVTTTDTFGSGGNAFTLDFVTIGNAGNAGDMMGQPKPAGSVAYEYRIGGYEVSEIMIEKANAASGLGITKDNRGANKPATSITWNEAARFVNWLNVSSGSTPAYRFSSQPGDGGYNVNETISLWSPGDSGYDGTNLFRNSKAMYFLPSENEWYKAAYYSSTGTYYNYANGSNVMPEPVASGTAGEVYGQSFTTGPADVTNAGGLSSYGTMGQGGNAWEWVETEADGTNNSSPSSRGLRGGAWDGGASGSSLLNLDVPSYSFYNIGFRVASVPEPSSLVLTMLAGSVMLIRRKR